MMAAAATHGCVDSTTDRRCIRRSLGYGHDGINLERGLSITLRHKRFGEHLAPLA